MLFERKLLIILLVVAVLTISISLMLYFIYKTVITEININSLNKSVETGIVNDSNCIEAGDYLRDSSLSCCPGLKAAEVAERIGDDCIHATGSSVCVNCPNGKCGPGENACNCPKDCAETQVFNELCDLEPRVGPCKALIERVYYDKEEKECKKFNWGGCRGVVPFETLEECQKDCEENLMGDNLLYYKKFGWGPCSNPDGGCWQREYLYDDGTHETITKSGTITKLLSTETMNDIIEFIKSSDLLISSCDYVPILDVWAHYKLILDGQQNKITFPGCEKELNKLDELIKSTEDGLTKTDCEVAGGDWNPCGSPCSLLSKFAPVECAYECLPLCECGDEKKYTCPERFFCNKQGGPKEVRGYCDFRAE